MRPTARRRDGLTGGRACTKHAGCGRSHPSVGSDATREPAANVVTHVAILCSLLTQSNALSDVLLRRRAVARAVPGDALRRRGR
jgi:hypothetical protein